MSRPRDWSPLACIDPVPGDPDRVEWLGKHYRQVAWAISDTARKLRQIADHQDMQSEAVEAFRNIAREVANDINRAHERYDGVGRALVGYAPELRDAQSASRPPHWRKPRTPRRTWLPPIGSLAPPKRASTRPPTARTPPPTGALTVALSQRPRTPTTPSQRPDAG